MYKKLLLSISLIASFINLSYGQIDKEDLKNINNTAEYKESNDALRDIFASSIRYPETLLQNPKYCNLIGTIKISREGKIVDYGAINIVDKVFEQQFNLIAKQIKGDWKFSNDTSDYFYVVIPIEFRSIDLNYNTDYSNKPDFILNTIVCTVFLQISDFKDDMYYLDLVEKYIAKEKYKTALKTLEILCTRQPFNSDYIRRMIELNKKIDDLEGIEYYDEYLKFLQLK